MGRNSKWEEVKDKLILVEGWARSGLTEEQIAHNLGIGYTTLKEYKNKYSSLMAALKRGKEVVDFEVEGALYKRAIGYKSLEVKTVTNPDGSVTTTETIKEVPADVTAQIFWLKNRKPDKWRDKVQQDVNLATKVIKVIPPKFI